MKLQHCAVALTFALATAVPAATAAEPAPPAACAGDESKSEDAMLLARGIVKVAFPDDQRSAMMQRLLSGITDQLRNARTERIPEPEIEALLERKLKEIPARLMPLIDAHMPRLLDATACAYTRLFSLQELRDISAFAHTPSGSSFLSRSTEALVDPAVAEANKTYFRALEAVAKEFQREVVEDILKLTTAEKPHKS